MLTLHIKSADVTIDVSASLVKLVHESSFNQGASSIRFSLLKTAELSFFEGDYVELFYNSKSIFIGRVFKKSRSNYDLIEVLAYDNLRYFKNRTTNLYKNKTASMIVGELAAIQGFSVGEICDSEYIISSLIAENLTCLDIICDALRRTLHANRTLYSLYCVGEAICLSKTANLIADVKITDSNLIGLSYTSDIDNVTANKIVIKRQTKDGAWLGDITRSDSENIAKWGELSATYVALHDESVGELSLRADNMLIAYNKVSRKLEISCEGDMSCIGGHAVYADLSLDFNISELFLIERATHSFEKNMHRMSLVLNTDNIVKTEAV